MFGKKQTGETSTQPSAANEEADGSNELVTVSMSTSDSCENVVSHHTANALVKINNVPDVLPDEFSKSKEGLRDTISKTQTHVERDVLVYTDPKLDTPDYRKARGVLIEKLVSGIDFMSLQRIPMDRRRVRVAEVADGILSQMVEPLTSLQIANLRQQALDEILGLGPLEPLLADADISDIMINTHSQVFVEKRGKIYLTDIVFLGEKHLMGIIQRIVTRVGRRVDESSPMVDARLADGSRFNAIIPPLALDGSLVSIRKFKKNKMSLRDYLQYESLSPQMCQFLEICGHIRLNILISGGTGSGKTTLLNALSGHIDHGERVITIEDAAELSLSQPHVLRLETRPASSEGSGEVTQRQLVKNALRMRPDRIILGEIRGEEVIDVLQAMNTGHDGSMATIHANTPRDCMARLESLIGMSGVRIPEESMRYQIASAVQLVVQLQRMRDGRRRITQIEEIIGVEGSRIATQTLFEFRARGMNSQGMLEGEFRSTGVRPHCLPKADYFGLEKEMLECIS